MSSFNESLSDSINLFQAIHVLQSKEDEMALKKNDSSSGNYNDKKKIPQLHNTHRFEGPQGTSQN
jgi:hypothetical protein